MPRVEYTYELQKRETELTEELRLIKTLLKIEAHKSKVYYNQEDRKKKLPDLA